MALETGLTADFAILRAQKADPLGNLRFYRTSRSFSPLMAMVGRTTIVAVEELVPFGALDPNDIHLPGVFVQRLFVGAGTRTPLTSERCRAGINAGQ